MDKKLTIEEKIKEIRAEADAKIAKEIATATGEFSGKVEQLESIFNDLPDEVKQGLRSSESLTILNRIVGKITVKSKRKGAVRVTSAISEVIKAAPNGLSKAEVVFGVKERYPKKWTDEKITAALTGKRLGYWWTEDKGKYRQIDWKKDNS